MLFHIKTRVSFRYLWMIVGARSFFWGFKVSKFHVNIIIGSWVMAIYFYKGLTRNPETGNTLIWVLPNIWRLRQVRNTKFGTNVSYKMLLNAAKCQGHSFYCFWAIKRKPTGGGGAQLPPTTIFTQIRVKKGIGNILYTKVNEKKEKTKLDLNCLNFKK